MQPFKFAHMLPNAQGLLAHTPQRTGVPKQFFDDELSKIGLTFSALALTTSGPWRVTSRNFSV